MKSPFQDQAIGPISPIYPVTSLGSEYVVRPPIYDWGFNSHRPTLFGLMKVENVAGRKR